MNTCTACHADIIWAVTQNGKSIPVNPEPVDNGNIELKEAIIRRGDGSLARTVQEAIVHGKKESGGIDLFDQKRYVSHWATCPNAKDFKGR